MIKRIIKIAGLLAVGGGFCACHQERRPRVRAVPEIHHQADHPLSMAPEETPKAKIVGRNADGVWVESVGRVIVGDQETRAQARAAAVDEARKSAMQDILGVNVKSRLLDFQQEGLGNDEQLIESVLQTTRQGRILDEKILNEGYADLADCRACRYQVGLRACLAEIKQADRDFHVDLGLSRTRFVDGDEAGLTVTASKDCYIYLYDVGADGETSLIVPNELVGEIRLKAGETYSYPNEELRRGGVHLVAQIPNGKNISVETIRVIASKTPLPRKLNDPALGGYLGVLRRLNASPIDWSDDAQAFTIYRR